MYIADMKISQPNLIIVAVLLIGLAAGYAFGASKGVEHPHSGDLANPDAHEGSWLGTEESVTSNESRDPVIQPAPEDPPKIIDPIPDDPGTSPGY